MKKMILLVILFTFCIFSMGCSTLKTNNNSLIPENKQQKVTYKEYVNDKFMISIEYPDTFKTKQTTMDESGIVFLSKNGDTELTLAGYNNIKNATSISVFNDLLKIHGKFKTKVQDENWFLVSWNEGSKTVYQKSVVGINSIVTFIIKYPTVQNDYYDPIVLHLYSSLKTPAIVQKNNTITGGSF